MSDEVLTQLKIHVEKAVRPLRISLLRKKRMREDLLAHILEIYDAEAANSDDETMILERTFERFGQPADIATDLRKNASFLEGITWLVESERIRPGESYLQVLGRHFLAGLFWILAVMPLPLIEFWQDGNTDELFTAVRILGTLIGILTFVSSLFIWFAYHYSIARFGIAENGTRSSGRFVWFSILILPVMMLMIYWSLGFPMPPDYMLIASIALAPLIPLCLMLTAKGASEIISHEFEWATLQLEE